jgi:hypothetical protein
MFGLAVLLICGLYVGLARYVAQRMEVRTQSKLAKYATIVVFVLIPTWDIIPGYLYFHNLCSRETGIKVFKTVEVEQSFFKTAGDPDEDKLSELFGRSMKVNRNFSEVFHIMKMESSIQDKRTGEVLGTATDLTYYGGWVWAKLFPQSPVTVCPVERSVHVAKWREVFTPKPIVRE